MSSAGNEVNPLLVGWRIENFDQCTDKPIWSPSFCIRNRNCNLLLCPERKDSKLSEFYFVIAHYNVFIGGTPVVSFDIELSLICEDDTLVRLEKVKTSADNSIETKRFKVQEELIEWNERVRLPMDTFTVLFRILWNQDCIPNVPAQLFMRTQLGLRLAISYEWSIKRLVTKEKKRCISKTTHMVSIPDKKCAQPYVFSSLSKKEKCKIRIHNIGIDPSLTGTCNLRLLDSNGITLYFMNEIEGILHSDGTLRFYTKLPILKKDEAENKTTFLYKGTSILHCDIRLRGIIQNEIQGISAIEAKDLKYVVGNAQTKSLLNGGATFGTDAVYASHHKHDVPGHESNQSTLLVAWDFSLLAGGETFPVHKAILSTTSSFFKSLFRKDAAEAGSNVFEFPDVDAHTLCRILIFVYKDTLDDLVLESAKKLFAAAGKYQFRVLEGKCSSFLRSNLTVSDACDILIMADDNRDGDLKAFVTDFIFENDGIISSDEWSELKENYPKLAADTLQVILQKSNGWNS